MKNTNKQTWTVRAIDSATGSLREESDPFVNEEDAHEYAEELRAKWTLATTVKVVALA